jgi:hypothetical protein
VGECVQLRHATLGCVADYGRARNSSTVEGILNRPTPAAPRPAESSRSSPRSRSRRVEAQQSKYPPTATAGNREESVSRKVTQALKKVVSRGEGRVALDTPRFRRVSSQPSVGGMSEHCCDWEGVM